MNPIRLLILCGGKSAEHEISLISGWNVCHSLFHSTIFDLELITITKNGNWFLQDISSFLDQEPKPDEINYGSRDNQVLLQPGNTRDKFFNIQTSSFLDDIDVVFPLLHGPNGEDGKIQGLLEILQAPYIGPGVLASAQCMDKVIAKQLMLQANIPTSAFKSYLRDDLISFDDVKQQLGLPLFIKPANMGSSVGVNKVTNEKEFAIAVDQAFQYDEKIIIEEFIDGIEVECAVLGNANPVVSEAGTYIHNDDFFDFDTKYKKNNEVVMEIPAKDLSPAEQREVQALSIKAYQTLGCKGMARVDTFYTTDGEFLVNEINTLPGFTQSSMYPILMEKCGHPYEKLIQQLCELAMDR